MFGLKVKIILALLALVAFLGAVGTALWYRSEAIGATAEAKRIEKELSLAVEVNKKNTKTIADLKQKAEDDRRATEKEIAATQSRAAAIDEISKDMDNVQGANDPAGSYWDTYGDRLRGSKRNH
jgi:hypothetical protein